MNTKTAIIIGAGPAGLTAALELLERSDIKPIVFEATDMVGGISRTVNYKGNRLDIGGHRFFSKSTRVMRWWLRAFPLEGIAEADSAAAKTILGGAYGTPEAANLAAGPDPRVTDRVMLFRSRISRILYGRKFYKYPLSLEIATFRNMGLVNTVRVGLSYVRANLFPIKPEKSLEDFFINRFGRELYLTFFKHYTEKVWGVSCAAIKPDWGAQRIKGLSVTRILTQAVSSAMERRFGGKHGDVETSLVENFLYPKYGPGQLWEDVAARVTARGGKVHMRHTIIGLHAHNNAITRVEIRDASTGAVSTIDADYVISTMPVRDLVRSIRGEVPRDVAQSAQDLQYRDFLTVGVLYSALRTPTGTLPDNWIYIQEGDVQVGRLQVFNNWSPYLTDNPDNSWLGLEYFCQEGDALWSQDDASLIDLAKRELAALGIADPHEFLDGVVVRMPKAYPAYVGGYEHFERIREFTDTFENLFLIGRNGMHRYNNQDHSMLAAMKAVDLILAGDTRKEAIWNVNTESEYHEGT